MKTPAELARIGAKPKKSLGQNFLVDKNAAKKICDAVPFEKNLRIIEIGPGTGALTSHLAENTDDLVLVEKDRALAGYLKEKYGQKAVVLEGDFLRIDPKEILKGGKAENPSDRKNFLVGNLPYNISKRILRYSLLMRGYLRGCVFTLQREVAEKITAPVNSKNYGILSVLFGFYSKIKVTTKLGQECFFPKPDVFSATVRILFAEEPQNPDFVGGDFEKIVKSSFRHRRKILLNNLKEFYAKEELALVEGYLHKRPQEISPVDFAEISIRLGKK
ncbi:ribosomal RNA small subunit methyltransferase A [candidate division WOR-3 bacterium]|nr:ribosomal RNA small subunit methyltransferase A [candidate division WOR-3 bacterium]